jgi:hypothetical protein
MGSDCIMSKEEFELQYSSKSGITLDEYYKDYITLLCNCNYENCKGWACVTNNPLSIKTHNIIYGK